MIFIEAKSSQWPTRHLSESSLVWKWVTQVSKVYPCLTTCHFWNKFLPGLCLVEGFWKISGGVCDQSPGSVFAFSVDSNHFVRAGSNKWPEIYQDIYVEQPIIYHVLCKLQWRRQSNEHESTSSTLLICNLWNRKHKDVYVSVPNWKTHTQQCQKSGLGKELASGALTVAESIQL